MTVQLGKPVMWGTQVVTVTVGFVEAAVAVEETVGEVELTMVFVVRGAVIWIALDW